MSESSRVEDAGRTGEPSNQKKKKLRDDFREKPFTSSRGREDMIVFSRRVEVLYPHLEDEVEKTREESKKGVAVTGIRGEL